jgi:hypothetical protein
MVTGSPGSLESWAESACVKTKYLNALTTRQDRTILVSVISTKGDTMCQDHRERGFGPSRHPHWDRPHYREWDDRPDRDFDRNCCCRAERAEPLEELDCDCDDEDVDENDFGFERRFVSKAETLKALEWYLDELQNEAQGVRESIADLKKEMAQAEAETAKAEKPAEPATSKARRTRKKKA